MPTKLTQIVIRHERTPLPDGRIIDKASIEPGNWVYKWQHVSDGPTDHDIQFHRIATGLLNREQVMGGLHALIGKDVGGATITECDIQIRGPMNWPVRLAWKHADGELGEASFDAPDPTKTMHPDAIVGYVQSDVARKKKANDAAIAAANFADVVSDPVPQ